MIWLLQSPRPNHFEFPSLRETEASSSFNSTRLQGNARDWSATTADCQPEISKLPVSRTVTPLTPALALHHQYWLDFFSRVTSDIGRNLGRTHGRCKFCRPVTWRKFEVVGVRVELPRTRSRPDSILWATASPVVWRNDASASSGLQNPAFATAGTYTLRYLTMMR